MAKNTFANKLFIALAPTAPTVALTALTSVTPPRVIVGMQDSTTHDNAGGAEGKLPDGTHSYSDVSFQQEYISGSADDLLLMDASTNKKLINFKIVEKGATVAQAETAQGYISEYGPDEYPVKGKQMASGTIVVDLGVTKAAVA